MASRFNVGFGRGGYLRLLVAGMAFQAASHAPDQEDEDDGIDDDRLVGDGAALET